MSLVSKTSSLSAHLLLAAAFTMPSGSVAAKELFDRMSVQDNLPMGAFVREMISNKGWSARRQWRVMMIRDILVTLPTGDATSIALDDAITVAGNFDAHLTGVAFVQDLTSAGELFATAAVLDHYRREVDAATEAAIVRFEEARQREGLCAELMVLTAPRSGSLRSLHAQREGSI